MKEAFSVTAILLGTCAHEGYLAVVYTMVIGSYQLLQLRERNKRLFARGRVTCHDHLLNPSQLSLPLP